MAAYNSFDGQSMLDMYASAISNLIKNHKTDLVSVLKKNNVKAEDSYTYEQLSDTTIKALKKIPSFKDDLSKMIIEVAQTGGFLNQDGANTSWWKDVFKTENLKKVSDGLNASLGIIRTGKDIGDEFGIRKKGGTGSSNTSSGGTGSSNTSSGNNTPQNSGTSDELLNRILQMKNNQSSMSTGVKIAIVAGVLVMVSAIVYLVVKSQSQT